MARRQPIKGMSEKTKLTILMAAVPWIFPILFGFDLYSLGMLQSCIIAAVGVSILCALLGREIGDFKDQSILAPAEYASANSAPIEKTHTRIPVDLKKLRAWQLEMHPFTCGSGRRTDEYHLDGEGILMPTPTGWTCPYCDYRQPYGDFERSI